jgi:hypothetical protein
VSLASIAMSMVPDSIVSKITSWTQIIKSLPFDGGPSVTRWVFLRTAEVISLGWLCLVGGAVYQYIRFAKADVIYCGMILTLGGGLFGFAQQTQVAKLSMDSKNSSSVESTPLSSTVKND